MPKSKKRKGAKKPSQSQGVRVVPLPPLFDTWTVFHYPDELLRQLRVSGALEAVGNTFVFRDHAGDLQALLPAMAGFVETWEYIEQQEEVVLQVVAMKKLLNKLYYASPITQLDLDQFALCLDLMKAYFNAHRSVVTGHAKVKQRVLQLQAEAGV